MKKLKALTLVILLIATLVAFAACANDNDEQPSGDDNQATAKTTLRIGTEPVARILAEAGVAPLEEMGYEVEIVMFDDYFTPNVALDEGSIDANFYQHQPFLDTYNEENGTDIVMLAPCFAYYSGIYSQKYTSLDEMKANGGKFIVANDASNQSLQMIDLQNAGLVTITDEEKDLYNIADIIDNPYNFEFIVMDSAFSYNGIEEVAGYFGSSNSMAAAGIDPTEDLLYYIDNTDQALGICVNAADADTQWAKDLVAAYTSDAAKQYVEENTNGANIPVE